MIKERIELINNSKLSEIGILIYDEEKDEINAINFLTEVKVSDTTIENE